MLKPCQRRGRLTRPAKQLPWLWASVNPPLCSRFMPCVWPETEHKSLSPRSLPSPCPQAPETRSTGFVTQWKCSAGRGAQGLAHAGWLISKRRPAAVTTGQPPIPGGFPCAVARSRRRVVRTRVPGPEGLAERRWQCRVLHFPIRQARETGQFLRRDWGGTGRSVLGQRAFKAPAASAASGRRRAPGPQPSPRALWRRAGGDLTVAAAAGHMLPMRKRNAAPRCRCPFQNLQAGLWRSPKLVRAALLLAEPRLITGPDAPKLFVNASPRIAPTTSLGQAEPPFRTPCHSSVSLSVGKSASHQSRLPAALCPSPRRLRSLARGTRQWGTRPPSGRLRLVPHHAFAMLIPKKPRITLGCVSGGGGVSSLSPPCRSVPSFQSNIGRRPAQRPRS
jgi:hypothetical protein